MKSVFGRDSTPDSAGGAHDTPTHPLVGWGGGHKHLHGTVLQTAVPLLKVVGKRNQAMYFFCTTLQATSDIQLALLMSIMPTSTNIYTESWFNVRRGSGYFEVSGEGIVSA